MSNEDTVTISKSEYDSLIKDSKWLNWLYRAGVDNSEAWGYAQELRSDAGEE